MTPRRASEFHDTTDEGPPRYSVDPEGSKSYELMLVEDFSTDGCFIPDTYTFRGGSTWEVGDKEFPDTEDDFDWEFELTISDES